MVGGTAKPLSQWLHSTDACQAVLAAPPRPHESDTDIEYYQKVFNGDVPQVTGELPRLRNYYSNLRQYADCLQNPDFLKIQPNVPNPDDVLNLVLYPGVAANLRRVHAKDLANLDTLLKGLRFKPSDMVSKVDFMNRKALIDWQRRVQNRLDSLPKDKAGNVANAKQGVEGVNQVFVNTNHFCVSVMEAEGKPDPSGCLNVQGLCQ